MNRWTVPLVVAALSVGFAIGVLSTASLDRRAAFRRHSDEWIEAHSDSLADVLRDADGWTAADHAGLEEDLRRGLGPAQ